MKVQTHRDNDPIKHFKSKSITETNDLIKAASVWVAKQIGLKKRYYFKGINFCKNKLMRNLFLRIWPKIAKISSANYNGKQQSQK